VYWCMCVCASPPSSPTASPPATPSDLRTFIHTLSLSLSLSLFLSLSLSHLHTCTHTHTHNTHTHTHTTQTHTQTHTHTHTHTQIGQEEHTTLQAVHHRPCLLSQGVSVMTCQWVSVKKQVKVVFRAPPPPHKANPENSLLLQLVSGSPPTGASQTLPSLPRPTDTSSMTRHDTSSQAQKYTPQPLL